MGCNCCRSNSCHEKLLQRAEKGFKLQNIAASTAIMAFTSHSSDGAMVTKSELTSTLDLMLEKNQLNQRSQLTEQYYSRIGDQKIPLRKLKCLAVLLSKDSPTIKSFLLFDTYDRDSDQVLTKDDIEIMMGDIWDISNNDIPDVARMLLEREDPDFNAYIEKILLITKGRITNYTLNFMFGGRDKIQRDSFSQTLTSTHLSALFCPSAFRFYCYSFKS